ncbi:MAG TPA: glycoside hydrolase family 20 zincin-like fold domain-containing protein, partial [Bacteroidales bacterium]|nr:glycoside hydrolase family 20 zincin-like fold domain-containing protein [Bacteroidales bacterium]
MKTSGLLLLTFIILVVSAVQAAEPIGISIVPKPAKMKPGKGNYLITDRTQLYFTAGNEEAQRTARLFAGHLQYSGGPVMSAMGIGNNYTKASGILFVINPNADLPSEGYFLRINK